MPDIPKIPSLYTFPHSFAEAGQLCTLLFHRVMALTLLLKSLTVNTPWYIFFPHLNGVGIVNSDTKVEGLPGLMLVGMDPTAQTREPFNPWLQFTILALSRGVLLGTYMVMNSLLLYICTNFMKYIPVHTITVSHNLSVCLKTKSDILILSQIQILQNSTYIIQNKGLLFRSSCCPYSYILVFYFLLVRKKHELFILSPLSLSLSLSLLLSLSLSLSLSPLSLSLSPSLMLLLQKMFAMYRRMLYVIHYYLRRGLSKFVNL